MLRGAYSAIPRYRPGPARAARTWLERDSGSNTSSVPRMRTALEPPSTKNAARGSRRAIRFLAAYREVVIQIDPAAKLHAAGLTSGRRAARRASMPIWARPRIEAASRLKRTRSTLGRRGFQGVPDMLQRSLEPLPDDPIEAPRDERADDGGRGHIRDSELDPDTLGGLGEREASLLPDQPRLRRPADLVRPAPAVQAQNASQRNPHRHHLHVVAGADAGGRGSNRLPHADAIEHLGHMAVVGEIVKGVLGRCVYDHRGRELERAHRLNISVCAGRMDACGSRTRWRSHGLSAAKSCETFTWMTSGP